MPLAMDDKDGERILQAVRNKTQQRRRDYRFRRVEVGRERSQILDQLVLMFRESFDYVTADLAGGRKRFRGRLHFLLVFRVEALDQEPAEESAERGVLFPRRLVHAAHRHTLEQRKIKAVRRYQVVETLCNAPTFFRRLPVKLFYRKRTEGRACVVRCLL